MNISELIINAKKQGVHLFVSEGRLGFKLAEGKTFPAELKLQLKQYKPEIVAFLQTVLDAQQSQKVDANNLQPIAREDKGYPLSYSQYSMWFIQMLDPQNVGYNLPGGIQINGEFDAKIAEKSFEWLLHRHESMRTVYREVDGECLQFVRDEFDFSMPIIDISDQPEDQQKQLINDYLMADYQRPFNLAEDLMFRAQFLKLNDKLGVMIFNMHHIATDGWSMKVLVAEFAKVYHAVSLNIEPDLEPLELQYLDYACWQQAHMKGPYLENQLSYWQKQLADCPMSHSLPMNSAVDRSNAIEAGLIVRELPSTTVTQMRQLISECSVTLFMLLHGIYGLTVSRFSGVDDVLIGTPIANRGYKGLESVVGYFINALVLRTSIDESLTVRDYLQHVRQVNMSAHSHSDIPFDLLVDKLCDERDQYSTPLFQLMLKVENKADVQLKRETLTISEYGRSTESGKFDIELVGMEHNGGLELSFKYNKAVFTEAFIQRFVESFEHILTVAVTQPDLCLSNIATLADNRLNVTRQLVDERLPTGLSQHNVMAQFIQVAQQYPESVALSHGGERLSYQALSARVASIMADIANNIGANTSVKGARIGVCLHPCVDTVAVQLAIFALGAVYVPLNPAHPQSRRDDICVDAGIELICSHGDLSAEHADAITVLDIANVSNNQQCIELTELAADDIAYIMYTSGTTGKPKGVAVAHGQLNHILANVTGLLNTQADDNVAAVASTAFDIAIVEMLMPLMSGAQVTLVDSEALTDIELLIEQTQNVTMLHAVPSLMALLLDEIEARTELYSQLRIAMTGGDKVPRALLERMQARFTQAEIFEFYGPTEAAVFSSYYRLTNDSEVEEHCIGKPLPGAVLSIRDNQQRSVPVGVVGELYIGGDGVAQGYWQQQDLTAQAFVSVDGKRCYRSGDLVYLDEQGLLRYVGRNDDQIKIRGQRIEPAEIERQLLACDTVEAVQVMISDEASPRIFAAVKSQNVDVQLLLAQLKSGLPQYMVPQTIISVEHWPLNVNGKVDRKQLLQLCMSQTEQQQLQPIDTPWESAVASAWQSVIEPAPQQMYKQDNFFNIGGHSLMLFKVMKHLRAQGHEVELKDLMEAQTLMALAKRLERNRIDGAQQQNPCLVRMNEAGQPLIFAFHPFGGRIDNYQPMAQQLNNRLTLIGVQAPFVSETSIRFDDLATLACYYVDQIQQLQPDGAYRLSGWSGGGTLAYLAAAELIARGAEVEYLALLDVYAPQAHTIPATAIERMQFVLSAYNIELDADLPQWQGLDDEALCLAVLDYLQQQGGDFKVYSESFLRTALLFGTDYVKAQMPSPTIEASMHIDQFYATENHRHQRNIEHWQQWLNSESIAIETDHVGIVDEQHVVEVSERIITVCQKETA